MDHPLYVIFMTLVTLYALFGDNVRILTSNRVFYFKEKFYILKE